MGSLPPTSPPWGTCLHRMLDTGKVVLPRSQVASLLEVKAALTHSQDSLRHVQLLPWWGLRWLNRTWGCSLGAEAAPGRCHLRLGLPGP